MRPEYHIIRVASPKIRDRFGFDTGKLRSKTLVFRTTNERERYAVQLLAGEVLDRPPGERYTKIYATEAKEHQPWRHGWHNLRGRRRKARHQGFKVVLPGNTRNQWVETFAPFFPTLTPEECLAEPSDPTYAIPARLLVLLMEREEELAPVLLHVAEFFKSVLWGAQADTVS